MTLPEFKRLAKTIVSEARDTLAADKYHSPIAMLYPPGESVIVLQILTGPEAGSPIDVLVQFCREHDPEAVIYIGEAWMQRGTRLPGESPAEAQTRILRERAGRQIRDLPDRIECLLVVALSAQWQCQWSIPFARVVDGDRVVADAPADETREIVFLDNEIGTLECAEGDELLGKYFGGRIAGAIPGRRLSG